VSETANVCTIAVVGIVGIPASYGGFETLVENLASFHARRGLRSRLVVYCSGKTYVDRPTTHLGAELRYVPLAANGMSSVAYDVVSLMSAIRHGADVCLLLGVSGAIALPLIRLFSSVRLVTNIDGVEWKREKWKGISKWFLKLSEAIAVRYSHEVIADNGAIARYVDESYGRACRVIAYGGDHAVEAPAVPCAHVLPPKYALALCRIEPENNPAMILEGFASNTGMPLIFIGNWSNSAFGRELRQRYAGIPHLHLLDPIYDPGMLRTIRSGAAVYVHGHSAGGTNPSLVEMMHFGVAIIAYDCTFNRFSTEGEALFFGSAEQLQAVVGSLTPEESRGVGSAMMGIARKRYTWSVVAKEYFDVLQSGADVIVGQLPESGQEVHDRLPAN
jgi:glycosyltransferase involved in cell wall biosynthesis